MIIVETFAETDHPNEIIVSALIGCIETAITKLGHMTDGVYRPGDVVIHQHRDVETPKHSGEAKAQEKCSRDEQMWQYIKRGVLPQTAIPDLSDIGGVTF